MTQHSLPLSASADAHAPLPYGAAAHPAARALVVLGAICVIGGGLLSAAFAPQASLHSSWAVAYIVLIPGVAQMVLGITQAAVTGGAVRRSVVLAEVLCWNLGALATVAGTILTIVPVLYAGAVLQVAALVLFLTATRHGRRGASLIALRIVSILLLVSVPTGIVLQATLH